MLLHCEMWNFFALLFSYHCTRTHTRVIACASALQMPDTACGISYADYIIFLRFWVRTLSTGDAHGAQSANNRVYWEINISFAGNEQTRETNKILEISSDIKGNENEWQRNASCIGLSVAIPCTPPHSPLPKRDQGPVADLRNK